MNESEYRRRNSIRLQQYDYSSAGGYFITICTRNKHLLFGVVRKGIMHLNINGEIALSIWNHLPEMYPSILLDEFVVMPNHVHGIIILTEPNTDLAVQDPKQKPSLFEIISWYKRSTTYRINRLCQSTGSIWQRSYYDRIIFNERALNAVRRYIRNNPRKWRND